MTTFWNRFEQALANDTKSILNWAETKAFPAIKNFLVNTVETEFEALLPIVEDAAVQVLSDPIKLVTGGPSAWGAAASSIISIALPQIESTGLKVAGESLHAAVGTVLSRAKAAASNVQT